jgi:hypothetical protein
VQGAGPNLLVGLAHLAMRVARLHLRHPLQIASWVRLDFALPRNHVSYGMLPLRLDRVRTGTAANGRAN